MTLNASVEAKFHAEPNATATQSAQATTSQPTSSGCSQTDAKGYPTICPPPPIQARPPIQPRLGDGLPSSAMPNNVSNPMPNSSDPSSFNNIFNHAPGK